MSKLTDWLSQASGGNWSRNPAVADTLFSYIESVSVREPDVLQRLREETNQLPDGNMAIGPDQGQFLSLILKLIGAKRTIEVGVFTGYSTLWTALALPDDGYVLACDVSQKFTSVGRPYWAEAGVMGKIDLILRPAAHTLQEVIDDGQSDTFDFAFIDADKSGYAGYYEQCLQLLRPGGLIAVDNVLWGGAVADLSRNDPDTKAIRALNGKIFNDDRVSISLVPIGDGLFLARKN
ncbi:MAG: class I SAM-dependent methyltransferase [Chloroflexota bacterium]